VAHRRPNHHRALDESPDSHGLDLRKGRMTRCHCGCGRSIPKHSETGRQGRVDRRYATNACSQRVRRRRRPGQPRTIENLRRWGREGGKTRSIGVVQRLLASLAHLNRDQAILEAYRRGKYAFYRIPKAQRAA
jgi:hypothetical protein